MAKGKTRMKEGVVFLIIFVAIILLALIIGWWEKHSALGWTIIGILLVIFGFSLYRFLDSEIGFLRKVKIQVRK